MEDNGKLVIVNWCAIALIILVAILGAIGIHYAFPERQKEVKHEEPVVEKPKSNVNVCGHIIGEEFVPKPEYKHNLKGDAYIYWYDAVTMITFRPVNGRLKYASITKLCVDGADCYAEYSEMGAYYVNRYGAKPQKQPDSLLTEDGVCIDLKCKIVDGKWFLSVVIAKLDK
jgi:hypothetical protein